MAGRGRPPRLGEDELSELKRIVENDPTATLAEIQYELERRTGVQAHEQTLLKGLAQAGIERCRTGCGVQIESAQQPDPTRYGRGPLRH